MKAHSSFTSYLNNREQFLCVTDQKSSTNSIDCGIPQVLCLWHLLFIIYGNDLEPCLQGAIPNIYADDISITCSSTDSDSLFKEYR